MKKFIATLMILGCVLIKPPVKYIENNTAYTSAAVNINAENKVVLGGHTVGIAIYTDGLLVTETVALETENGKISPCELAGINVGDYLLKADGNILESAVDLDKAVKSANGKQIEINLIHNGQNTVTYIQPIKIAGEYRLGMWLKDGAAGLGTVTFFEPENGYYMALGHSVGDGVSKNPLAVKNGCITECTVTGVEKATKSKAGELKGTFSTDAKIIGTVEENTKFGIIGRAKSNIKGFGEIEFGKKEEISLGFAEIYTDFEGGEIKPYSIKITKINSQSVPKEKSMQIKVTDNRLIEKTGGIVQGLSGSPIVQNGKLIGAVTHVMLADSTKGYGIFIENMLSVCENVNTKAG